MQIGDHLVVPRLCYTHHGLYVGDGSVIHYSGLARDTASGVVELIDLASFADGDEIHVRDYAQRKYARQESVDRARSRLGENAYNVLLNNCEHFVSWCITGSHSSRQVERPMTAGIRMLSMPGAENALLDAPALIRDRMESIVTRLETRRTRRAMADAQGGLSVPTAARTARDLGGPAAGGATEPVGVFDCARRFLGGA